MSDETASVVRCRFCRAEVTHPAGWPVCEQCFNSGTYGRWLGETHPEFDPGSIRVPGFWARASASRRT
jgi:hypothetical protein